jgi:hypothetical protein
MSQANASWSSWFDESVLGKSLLEAFASVCVQDGIELIAFEDNCAIRRVDVDRVRFRCCDVESGKSVLSPAEDRAHERERQVEALLHTYDRELLVDASHSSAQFHRTRWASRLVHISTELAGLCVVYEMPERRAGHVGFEGRVGAVCLVQLDQRGLGHDVVIVRDDPIDGVAQDGEVSRRTWEARRQAELAVTGYRASLAQSPAGPIEELFEWDAEPPEIEANETVGSVL